jgi:hypothetical protein
MAALPPVGTIAGRQTEDVVMPISPASAMRRA